MSVRRYALLLFALGLGAGAALPAQTPARLVFEVASIHPAKPEETRGYIKPLDGGMG